MLNLMFNRIFHQRVVFSRKYFLLIILLCLCKLWPSVAENVQTNTETINNKKINGIFLIKCFF